MSKAQASLELLKQGHQRFLEKRPHERQPSSQPSIREEDSPVPLAAVLSCSDARVPPEILFDCGIGDLFVVRVAGNIPTQVALGTIELALEVLGVRLIVVLGHTDCKAVATALAHLHELDDEEHVVSSPMSPNLAAILEQVEPALDAARTKDGLPDPRQAVFHNIEMAVEALGERSEVIRRMLEEDGLLVASALYSVEDHRITFLDNV